MLRDTLTAKVKRSKDRERVDPGVSSPVGSHKQGARFHLEDSAIVDCPNPRAPTVVSLL